MTAVQASIIRSCAALSHGDEIEAWHDGRLLQWGRVIQTVPSMQVVWIICARTGTRQLVDLEASKVIRAAVAPASGPPMPESTPSCTTAAEAPGLTNARKRIRSGSNRSKPSMLSDRRGSCTSSNFGPGRDP
jgi:hypothetical protein